MSRKRKQYERKDLVTIVICVFGKFDLLKRCMDALPEAFDEIPYKVILYDNASPDKQEASDYYRTVISENVTIVRSKENLGFVKACNLGAKRAKTPYIFFLNSDIILEPNCMKLMIEKAKEEKVGVVGMKLIFPDDSIDPARPAGMLQHIGLETNIRGEFYHVFIGWKPDHYKINKVESVYAVTGAALLTHRNIWMKSGGFFAGYGIGTYEDIDFCLTVRSMGYKIVVEPLAIGTHYVGATSLHYQIPFPLEENKTLFMSRWGKRLIYTEWQHL